jgi:hypothetical protein
MPLQLTLHVPYRHTEFHRVHAVDDSDDDEGGEGGNHCDRRDDPVSRNRARRVRGGGIFDRRRARLSAEPPALA